MVLSVVIPVYNERNTIHEILKRIEQVDLNKFSFGKEIVVVDDGSNDGTRDILKGMENKYRIIYHPENRGKGAAVRTGLQHISGDYVIIQDADLEYDPQDYKQIIDCALKNNAQAVYGSRRLNPKNMHRYVSYYWGGIFLNWATRLISGMKISDESTCYKFFKADFIKAIPLKCDGFEFCPEITAKIAKRGIRIHEVPISYYPRSVKEGKKIRWRDGVKALWTLIKYKFLTK